MDALNELDVELENQRRGVLRSTRSEPPRQLPPRAAPRAPNTAQARPMQPSYQQYYNPAVGGNSWQAPGGGWQGGGGGWQQPPPRQGAAIYHHNPAAPQYPMMSLG